MNRDLLGMAIRDLMFFIRHWPYFLLFYILLFLLAYHENQVFLIPATLLLAVHVLLAVSLFVRMQYHLYKVMSE